MYFLISKKEIIMKFAVLVLRMSQDSVLIPQRAQKLTAASEINGVNIDESEIAMLSNRAKRCRDDKDGMLSNEKAMLNEDTIESIGIRYRYWKL